MATTETTWKRFDERQRELADLGGAASILNWDEQTYISAKGRDQRAKTMAALSALLHERIIDAAFGDDLAELAVDGTSLSPAQRAMVRNVKHDRDRAVRLPADLVRRLAEAGSRTNRAWEEARRERDFSLYEPLLTEMIALKVEQAEALRENGTRYDALLDAFEPGMRVAQLEPILHALRAELVPFAQSLLDRPPLDDAFLHRAYPDEGQWELSQRLLHDVGFDMKAGRLDFSAHPFSGGVGPFDVRLTTRFDDHHVSSGIFSTVHEAGHGMYEQGMAPDYLRTAVAHAPSLGLHESQSRFWENIVGRSRPFWEHYLPVAAEIFPEQLRDVSVDAMYRAVNKVASTPIRVEADEVTYNLHILVRFELELALIDDKLAVADLPGAWREKMEKYLGYTPKDDVEGVMQDIHWSWGELGYFPTYTLGNLYSAAIADSMGRDLDLAALVGRAEFSPVLGWLREKIHHRGYILTGEELMQDVTGRPLSHDAFMAYLRDKFSRLYAT